MGKQIRTVLGVICYLLGVVASLYIGVWKMVCLPVRALIVAAVAGEFTVALLAACAVKILLSTTFAGLVWCIGYMGYNYFKGTEDPDWDEMEEQRSYCDSKGA